MLPSNEFAGVLHVVVDTASSGATELVAAAEGKKIRVLNYALVSTSANGITFASGATEISGPMAIAANGGISATGHYPLFSTTAGKALNISLSGATQVSGHVSYYLEG